jgi:hypothetical protein
MALENFNYQFRSVLPYESKVSAARYRIRQIIVGGGGSDCQPLAGCLPTLESTTQKNADIHASCGIRTCDPSVWGIKIHALDHAVTKCVSPLLLLLVFLSILYRLYEMLILY